MLSEAFAFMSYNKYIKLMDWNGFSFRNPTNN